MRSISAAALASVLLLALQAAAHAADPAVTCESGKLKEAGKYGSCRLSALSKAAKTGDPVDYAKCDGKFNDKWPAIETKGGGLCPSNGDQTDITQRIVEHTDDMAVLLSGGAVGTHKFPASGQTASYGAGDDGNLQPGGTLTYVDNGDGTITDGNTSLMWEKKIGYNAGFNTCTNETGPCADPHNADNNYSWTAVSPAYDGKVVTIFLEQLNNRCDLDTTVACTTDADCSVPGGSCGFAGHRDWRLPSLKELQSIVDYSIASPGPSIQPAFNGGSCGPACTDLADPACSCTYPTFHMSSTTSADFSTHMWQVSFFDGSVNRNTKGSTGFVRAVRGGV